MNEGPEAVVQRCFVKKVFLEISQSSQEDPCARASFLIKLQAEACNFIKKETLAQIFQVKTNKFISFIDRVTYMHKISVISKMISLVEFNSSM